MVGPIFGVDFGTTNSLASVVQGSAVLSLVDRQTDRPHPSVVWYRGGEVVVGREARDHLDLAEGSAPLGLLRSPKMKLRRQGPIHLEGRAIDPTDAVSEVLRHLRNDARIPRPGGRPFHLERAVMTIPVDFEGPQRRALREAARKAGLSVVQFAHEPAAALYAYLRGAPDFQRQVAELENQVLLVFDWGGGTLDLTICRLLGRSLLQIRSVGNNEIGGDVFDERLRNLVRSRHSERHALEDTTALEAPGMGARLLAQCEQAKILMSNEESDVQRVFVRDYLRTEGAARNLVVAIGRADLYDASASLVRAGLGMIDQLLADARLDYADVALCLPTGGMVNMPAIRNGLVERFGGRVPALANGDRIISEGAAWIAHDGLRLSLSKPIEVRVADGSGAGHYHVLVNRGFGLPTENQTVGAVNEQFVCADPRNGVAVFEFVKPSRVGHVRPEDERETLCEVAVAVNPNTVPLFERLSCKVNIDHDYVALATVKSLGTEAEVSAEFHNLDFGLTLPGIVDDGLERDASKEGGHAPGTAPVRGRAGAVSMRPNILLEKTESSRHAVAGDVAHQYWPEMFDPRRPEATRRQQDERMYYAPCSVCGRSLYKIQNEPMTPRCRPEICGPMQSGTRVFGA